MLLVKQLEELKSVTITVLLTQLERYGKIISKLDNFEFTDTSTFVELNIDQIFPDGSYSDWSGEKWNLSDVIDGGELPINDAVYFAEELLTYNIDQEKGGKKK